jgi:hypothetical protein
MFLDETDTATEDVVADIVASAMFDNSQGSDLPTVIRRFIANNRDNIPKVIINIDDAVRFIQHSIVIKRLNLVKKEDIGTGKGAAHPAWNLYIHPPTTKQAELREWRNIIRRTIFVTGANKSGRTVKLFNCTICRSEDHPGGMCPYPSQRLWVTPTPPTASPALEAIINPPSTARTERSVTTGGRGAQQNIRGRATNTRGRVRP